ncbi:hypothetical protein L6164_036797 [Bauhinia variegata]|uniref:Uncharacterized protein n=1 Tax=Bauhinia variegata TaxID=167791 RepID=A0ACB9KI67_BAUVA|nr:hypothetical protein L6164_036797 [Bauhinia variegata]
MDFNLDGEFDKISSFKVDMSDLDFSCPPKIPAKSKEKNEGESSGAKEGKQDDFNFSFDFNELDSFNLDSCLTKGDMTLNSRLNKNVITAGGSDHGATRRPKPSDAEGIHASKDSEALKSLASDREETSKEKTFVCNPGDRVSTSDDSFSKFSSSGDLGMSVGARTSSDIFKTSTTEERDQERELPEKTKSSESKSQEVINKPLSNLVEQNDSEQESIPDQHIEPCSQGKNLVTDSGDKQKANHYKVTSDGENLPSESSSPLHI